MGNPRSSDGRESRLTEDHFHTEQLCAGDDGGNDFEDGGLTSWQLTTDAVADVFGSEVQIYSGSLGAGVHIDVNKILPTAVSQTGALYLIEFWAGSGAFGAATRVSSVYVIKDSQVGSINSEQKKNPRIRGDLNIWARVKNDNAGADTIDFVLEYHKYPSDTGDEVNS